MTAYRALLAGSLLSAALASAVPTTASAAGELVSRADGADGAAIADAQLVTATRNGRFVLFSGPASAAAPAESPDRRTFFLRDRETDITTPVLRADGASGAIWSVPSSSSSPAWTALDVSPDGTKVLFSGPRFEGGARTALYVRDVAANTTTVVSWLPSGDEAFTLAGTARFIKGGAEIIFGAAGTDGARATYTRALLESTTKLYQDGVALTSSTADGQTITWSRPLAPAKRPASTLTGSGWTQAYNGVAVGYTVKGEAPVVTARSKVTERTSAPGAYCYIQGVSTETSTPLTLLVNDTGTLLHKQSRGDSSTYPYSPTSFSDRPARGAWPAAPRTTTGGLSNRWVTHTEFDLGETGDVILAGDYRSDYGYFAAPVTPQGAAADRLPPLGDWSRERGATGARLFADDSGVVIGEQSLTAGSTDRVEGVYAYDPVNTVPTTAPTTPAMADGEILDDPSLSADVTWAECPAVPAPTSADFVTTTFNTPFASGKSAGTVSTRDLRGTGAAVTKTTLTVKTFGFTTWTKTLPGINAVQTTVALPKPWLFLPQTLTVDTELQKVGDAPAKHVVLKQSWQAWK